MSVRNQLLINLCDKILLKFEQSMAGIQVNQMSLGQFRQSLLNHIDLKQFTTVTALAGVRSSRM